MLRGLSLGHFRSFSSGEVKLDNPTFLVGQNGTGKSNFTDAISFIAEAMESPLPAVFRRRGGFETVVHRTLGGRRSTIRFELDLDALNDHAAGAKYSLDLRVRRDHGLHVARERCIVQGIDGNVVEFDRRVSRGDGGRIGWRGDTDSPNLGPAVLALPLIGDARFTPVFDFLANMRTYRIDPVALHRDRELYGGAALNRNGSNAARVLHRIRRQSHDDWEEICGFLGHVVPEIAGVHSRRRGDELDIEFIQRLDDGKVRFRASDMSDGTLRVLGLLMAAYQRPAPSVLVVEEPEASVHPGALGVVLDVLWHARHRSQVVVTTHSPDVLDASWIGDRHLRMVSWKNGETCIGPVSPSVENAMKNHSFSAGELLRSNALHGDERP